MNNNDNLEQQKLDEQIEINKKKIEQLNDFIVDENIKNSPAIVAYNQAVKDTKFEDIIKAIEEANNLDNGHMYKESLLGALNAMLQKYYSTTYNDYIIQQKKEEPQYDPQELETKLDENVATINRYNSFFGNNDNNQDALKAFRNALISKDKNDIENAIVEANKLDDNNVYKKSMLEALDTLSKQPVNVVVSNTVPVSDTNDNDTQKEDINEDADLKTDDNTETKLDESTEAPAENIEEKQTATAVPEFDNYSSKSENFSITLNNIMSMNYIVGNNTYNTALKEMNNLMRVFSNENFAKAENAINAIIDENKKANLLEIYNTMKFIKIEYRKMNEHTGYVGQITPRAIAELIANLNSTLPEDKKAVIEKIVEIGKCKAKIRTANLNEMQKETNRIFNDESRVDSEHGYLDVEKESTSSDNHNNIISHAEMVDMLVRDMENGVRDAHGEPIQKEAQEESHGMGMAAFTSLTTIALLSALSAIQIIILGVLFTR